MKRVVLTVCASLLGLLVVVYAGDYAMVQYKIASKRNPFEMVKVNSYYAVPRKDGRLEFMFNDPVDQQCIDSLFPHMAYDTCWSLKRKTDRRIDLFSPFDYLFKK